MSKAKDLHEKWLENPAYQAAYESMGEEFELASAIISARDHAGLTQEELAVRMQTNNYLIVRLEADGQNTTYKELHKQQAHTFEYPLIKRQLSAVNLETGQNLRMIKPDFKGSESLLGFRKNLQTLVT